MRKAKDVIFGLMFCMNIGLTLVLLYLFVGRGYRTDGSFTGVEVITVVLAALAVMLTALGFFIAMLAIWGYQSLNAVAENTARRTTKKLVKSALPALMRRELSDQVEVDDVLGDEGSQEAQAAVDSLDGDKK